MALKRTVLVRHAPPPQGDTMLRDALKPPFIFLLLLCAPALSAQGQGEERYYLYEFTELGTASTEKNLGELLSGFHPDVHVSIDRPSHRLKLRSTVDIPAAEVIALAAQIGVQLAPVGPMTVAPTEATTTW